MEDALAVHVVEGLDDLVHNKFCPVGGKEAVSIGDQLVEVHVH